MTRGRETQVQSLTISNQQWPRKLNWGGLCQQYGRRWRKAWFTCLIDCKLLGGPSILCLAMFTDHMVLLARTLWSDRWYHKIMQIASDHGGITVLQGKFLNLCVGTTKMWSSHRTMLGGLSWVVRHRKRLTWLRLVSMKLSRHNFFGQSASPSCLRSVLNYSGPSILRPPMGPRKYGLILQVVLK